LTIPASVLAPQGGPAYDGRMAKTPKRPRDPNQLARLIVDLATGDQREDAPPPVNEQKSAAGRLGGAARAALLSDDRRADIARSAALVRKR